MRTVLTENFSENTFDLQDDHLEVYSSRLRS